MSKTKNTNSKSATSKTTASTKTTPVNNNSKTKKTTVTFADKAVEAFFNSTKNTKTVEPVNNKSTTKKTTVANTDSVSIKSLTNAYNYGTKQQTTKKMPPTHSAYNQLGKKRGSYSQNIWVIEASKDGKKWSPSDDSYTFYNSRDEARDDVASLRSGDDTVLRFRVAKYTFTAVSHS